MADEFPCRHRASTKEFREGWGLIWDKKEESTILGVDIGSPDGDRSNVRDVSVEEIEEIIERHNASKNQCDGCIAGYPVNENGTHIVPYPSGTMVCQKTKYQSSTKD